MGVVAGLVMAVAVFLPWYATNLGPPFSAISVSGWESTNVARVVLLMGVVLAAASAAAALDERRVIALDPGQADALAWIAVAAAGIALVLVGFRILVMPDPAEFLSRQIGIFLAAAAAIGGILSGLAQAAVRS